MNVCERYEELISALLDGELSAEEEAEVRAHMADCPDCRAMYEAFAAVGEALREQDVPDTLHSGIMETVTAAEKASRTQHTIVRLRPVLAAAACLVVLVGTVFALKNTVGFGRVAMKSSEAAPQAAEAPAALYTAGSSASGSAAEPETPMQDSMLLESKAETAAASAEDNGLNGILDAMDAPVAAATDVTADNAPAAAQAAFELRLEAVEPGALTGVVADETGLAFTPKDAEITVAWDGDTTALKPGMRLLVTVLSEQTEAEALRALDVSVIE